MRPVWLRQARSATGSAWGGQLRLNSNCKEPFQIRKFGLQHALDAVGEPLEWFHDNDQAVPFPLCFPGRPRDAVHKHHSAQEAASRVDAPGMLSGNREFPRAVAEKISVVGG